MSQKYKVTVPIAGHAIIEVRAENKEAAIDNALKNVQEEHIADWEALPRLHEGRVCYCPYPWEAEAEVVDDD